MSWDEVFLINQEPTSDAGSSGDDDINSKANFSSAEEVSKYMKSTKIDVKAPNPLSFWETHQIQFPNLAKLAKIYLCPPASSTASEREFKVAKNIQTDKRANLLPKNLETLLFLKYNLRALSYQIDLPSPPKNFISPNNKEYDTDPIPSLQEKGPGRQQSQSEEEEEDSDYFWSRGVQADLLDLLNLGDEDMDQFEGFPPVFSEPESEISDEEEEDQTSQKV